MRTDHHRTALGMDHLRGTGRPTSGIRDRIVDGYVDPWLAMFFLAIAFVGWEWYRWAYDFAVNPVYVTMIGSGIALIAIARHYKLHENLKRFASELQNESQIGEILERDLMSKGHRVYRDVRISEDHEIDCAIIGPKGVFAVETTALPLPTIDTSVIESVSPKHPSLECDPIRRAWAVAKDLQALILDCSGHDVDVQPVVMSVAPRAPERSIDSGVWVADERGFLDYVQQQRSSFDPQTIQFLSENLENYLRTQDLNL